jgi:hypothetical protein
VHYFWGRSNEKTTNDSRLFAAAIVRTNMTSLSVYAFGLEGLSIGIIIFSITVAIAARLSKPSGIIFPDRQLAGALCLFLNKSNYQ